MISVDDFGFCAEVRLKCINHKGAKTQGVAYTEYVYDAQLRVSFSIKELVGSGATALPDGRSSYSHLTVFLCYIL